MFGYCRRLVARERVIQPGVNGSFVKMLHVSLVQRSRLDFRRAEAIHMRQPIGVALAPTWFPLI
jgi:hypothetical protein